MKRSPSRAPAPRPPRSFVTACRRRRVRPTRHLLCACVATQTMDLFEQLPATTSNGRFPAYAFVERYTISTSRFGIGQREHSRRTPLGLHRIARKIGQGEPVGTVFLSRRPVGLTWGDMPQGGIVHRILWLQGLEPGLNQGGDVDTFRRFIYIHGYWDESTLGRPRSQGCIHLGVDDLLRVFERVATGTLVHIRR